MTLPHLNTPIQHTGGATCPFCGGCAEDEMRTGVVVCINCGASAPRWQDWNRRVIARAPADRIKELEAVIIDAATSLAAAISLLDRGGKAAKKAAASDKMFDQMMNDYRGSLERARAALKGATE